MKVELSSQEVRDLWNLIGGYICDDEDCLTCDIPPFQKDNYEVEIHFKNPIMPLYSFKITACHKNGWKGDIACCPHERNLEKIVPWLTSHNIDILKEIEVADK